MILYSNLSNILSPSTLIHQLPQIGGNYVVLLFSTHIRKERLPAIIQLRIVSSKTIYAGVYFPLLVPTHFQILSMRNNKT